MGPCYGMIVNGFINLLKAKSIFIYYLYVDVIIYYCISSESVIYYYFTMFIAIDFPIFIFTIKINVRYYCSLLLLVLPIHFLIIKISRHQLHALFIVLLGNEFIDILQSPLLWQHHTTTTYLLFNNTSTSQLLDYEHNMLLDKDCC